MWRAAITNRDYTKWEVEGWSLRDSGEQRTKESERKGQEYPEMNEGQSNKEMVNEQMVNDISWHPDWIGKGGGG